MAEKIRPSRAGFSCKRFSIEGLSRGLQSANVALGGTLTPGRQPHAKVSGHSTRGLRSTVPTNRPLVNPLVLVDVPGAESLDFGLCGEEQHGT